MASPSNGNARQRCRWLSNPVSRRAAAQKAPTTPPQPISFDYGRGAPVRGRDGAFDPGGATASRITMPHVCFRRFRASRPPQRYLFRDSIPPTRSLCTLRIRRCRRLRNTRFPAARYRLTGAGLSPAGSRQLRLTHRNRKFESTPLQRRVRDEPMSGLWHPDRRDLLAPVVSAVADG